MDDFNSSAEAGVGTLGNYDRYSACHAAEV